MPSTTSTAAALIPIFHAVNPTSSVFPHLVATSPPPSNRSQPRRWLCSSSLTYGCTCGNVWSQTTVQKLPPFLSLFISPFLFFPSPPDSKTHTFPAMTCRLTFGAPLISSPIRVSAFKKAPHTSGKGRHEILVKIPEIPSPILGATVAVGSLLVAESAKALPMQNVLEGVPLPLLADIDSGGWLSGLLYSAGQQANDAVQDQLSALSFSSLAVIFGAGLVTSLSPCTLSVLPLTLGYIGAYGAGKSRAEIIWNSVSFSLGLATTLAILGIAASFAGKAYGQIGQGLPVAASCLAVVMGLNLLEIIELQLPSFFDNFDPRAAAANFPSSVQAYLAGLTFALAASPCSTPVLATLLGYVAASRDPIVGGSLLLTYTTGYIAPLLAAASFAGALQSLLSFRKFSAWINPISGGLLLGGGVYTLLDRAFPTTMVM